MCRGVVFGYASFSAAREVSQLDPTWRKRAGLCASHPASAIPARIAIGQGTAAPSHEVDPALHRSWVQKIKQVQRSEPDTKQKWERYCDAHGGGIRDPQRHDSGFLRRFFDDFLRTDGACGGAMPPGPPPPRPRRRARRAAPSSGVLVTAGARRASTSSGVGSGRIPVPRRARAQQIRPHPMPGRQGHLMARNPSIRGATCWGVSVG